MKIDKFTSGIQYIDSGSWRQRQDDEFNLAFASGDKAIENCGGIRRRYFINDVDDFRLNNNRQRIPSVLVLISTINSISGRLDNPWSDELISSGLIYYGDNRTSTSLKKMKGCQNLLNINKLTYSGQEFLKPPILHFIKNKIGFVEFTGRYELKDIQVYPFVNNGIHVENLKCNLKLIDKTINMKWIRERSLAINSDDLKLIDNNHAAQVMNVA